MAWLTSVKGLFECGREWFFIRDFGLGAMAVRGKGEMVMPFR